MLGGAVISFIVILVGQVTFSMDLADFSTILIVLIDLIFATILAMRFAHFPVDAKLLILTGGLGLAMFEEIGLATIAPQFAQSIAEETTEFRISEDDKRDHPIANQHRLRF
jgi:hypothetical protein